MKKIGFDIRNKKASFDYELSDKYVAGIVLTGTEIKSIREAKASLVDTYVAIENGEAWLINSYIAQYSFGSYANHEERRKRKLLLNKKEIHKLAKEILVPGVTIIPIRLFENEYHIAKVEISLARGKKQYDKRESIKKADDKRETQRYIKNC